MVSSQFPLASLSQRNRYCGVFLEVIRESCFFHTWPDKRDNPTWCNMCQSSSHTCLQKTRNLLALNSNVTQKQTDCSWCRSGRVAQIPQFLPQRSRWQHLHLILWQMSSCQHVKCNINKEKSELINPPSCLWCTACVHVRVTIGRGNMHSKTFTIMILSSI